MARIVLGSGASGNINRPAIERHARDRGNAAPGQFRHCERSEAISLKHRTAPCRMEMAAGPPGRLAMTVLDR